MAVVCEELVEECITCSGLYFFEFISCSAFLLSLLILYVYCTDLYESLGEAKVQKLVRKLFFFLNKPFLLSAESLLSSKKPMQNESPFLLHVKGRLKYFVA